LSWTHFLSLAACGLGSGKLHLSLLFICYVLPLNTELLTAGRLLEVGRIFYHLAACSLLELRFPFTKTSFLCWGRDPCWSITVELRATWLGRVSPVKGPRGVTREVVAVGRLHLEGCLLFKEKINTALWLSTHSTNGWALNHISRPPFFSIRGTVWMLPQSCTSLVSSKLPTAVILFVVRGISITF
jgi:hypothetical protein